MIKYFKDNGLVINVGKTQVMIISKNKDIKKQSVTINKMEIKNSDSIKILGTYLHSSLNFNFNFLEVKNNILTQLKRRENAIKNIRRYVNKKMLKTIANAIFRGKIMYHLAIWPNINRKNKEKVNKMLENVAKMILGNEYYGRTRNFILNKIGWNTIDEMQEMAISKFTNKILNNDQNYVIKNEMTINRERRTLGQNKIGILPIKYGMDKTSQNSIIIKAKSIYNNLPKELTLIQKPKLFKKWIKIFYLNKNIKIKNKNKSYTEIKNNNDFKIDYINVIQCQLEYEFG